MRITVGNARIAHHGAHSGYWRLIPALRRLVPVRWFDGARGSPLPGPVSRALIARAGVAWYDERSLAVELGLARALLGRRSSVCHALYVPDALRYSPIARRLGRNPLVATVHQPPAVFEESVADKGPLRRCDAVIAMSSELCEHLAGYVGDERVFRLPLGVDTEFFSPPPSDEQRDPAVCLFVGWWQRDLDVLEAVVRQARELRFRAIVPLHARERMERIPGLEVSAGVPDAELLSAYRSAGLFVLPLRDATMNGAALEAAACGLPIVATAVGGVPEHLDGAAELVPRGDAEAMADRVLALAGDDARRRELAAAARQRALEHDWSIVARRHLEVYRRTLAQWCTA